MEEEPEPEWMEFGPTDRFDVIELKGFDKEELEKEGILVESCVYYVARSCVNAIDLYWLAKP